MHDIPSPLDHLAAFVLVFGLGALSACLWNASLCLLKAPVCRDTVEPSNQDCTSTP
jgi:hypothetical protein